MALATAQNISAILTKQPVIPATPSNNVAFVITAQRVRVIATDKMLNSPDTAF